jgi:hypothetical protein
MSNPAPVRPNQQPKLPTPPSGDTIARFATYLEAQKAVDYLSDHHFPVQAVTIVGVDLKMVERVTGRLTYARAAIVGFGGGAYFGLMVGVLIVIFGNAKGFSLPVAIIFGGLSGSVLAMLSYGLTGGQRDFTSSSQIVAGEYQVLCLTEQAGQAIQLLNELAREGGPTGKGGGPSAPATAPVTPAPGYPSTPFPSSPTAGLGAEDAVEPGAPVTGPTYSEMIDRKKAEDRERAESERAESERAESERAAPQPPAEESRRQSPDAPPA